MFDTLVIDTTGLDIGETLGSIVDRFDELENYGYLLVVNHGDWVLLSEVAVYLESFLLEKGLNIFNRVREERIEELKEWLQEWRVGSNGVEELYSGVGHGFVFKDLFIEEDGEIQVLIMQKVVLDNTKVSCPVCDSNKLRSNGFNGLLFRSFECANEDCSARSEGGRGKRFDGFSVKRSRGLLKVENEVEEEFVKVFRRDVFEEFDGWLSVLTSFYSWVGDTILCVNCEVEVEDRKVEVGEVVDSNYSYRDLPFYRVLENLNEVVFEEVEFNGVKIGDCELFNENSFLIGGSDLEVDAVVTSPPYYNAREYSIWVNLYCYLIDMFGSVLGIEKILKDDGYYLYNVGDVVGVDNNYVSTGQKSKRLILGFYSVILFKMAGFSLSGVYIWDKGEVESKRGLLSNGYPGFLFPFNCYEYCFLFKKGEVEEQFSEVVKFSPVKKIDKSGVNILGHSAPFPLELPKLIKPFLKEGSIILDNFVGSGTTCIALGDCEQVDKVIGFELDKEYFELALKRVRSTVGFLRLW